MHSSLPAQQHNTTQNFSLITQLSGSRNSSSCSSLLLLLLFVVVHPDSHLLLPLLSSLQSRAFLYKDPSMHATHHPVSRTLIPSLARDPLTNKELRKKNVPRIEVMLQQNREDWRACETVLHDERFTGARIQGKKQANQRQNGMPSASGSDSLSDYQCSRSPRW